MDYKKANELKKVIMSNLGTDENEYPELNEIGMELIVEWVDNYVKEVKK
jgi:hypothetical protein